MILSAFSMSGPEVLAQPTGGSVVAGSANINQIGGALNVNQFSDRAVINWQQFSIGTGQSANFNLPSSSSAILNRVTGANSSAIMGTLQSNGNVYLINPNGILIGPGANITVGGLVASTLNVPDAEFMQGGSLSFEGNSNASVINHGSVQALEGNVYMIGAHVENHGTITASNGTVGLAAGQSVLLGDSAHPQLVVRATPESLGGTGVLNTGMIAAARAELIANGGNVYGLAINNQGTIRASGAEVRHGRIFLVSDGGRISSSGDLIARRGNNGGDVILHAGGTGNSYVVVSGSIDVAGAELGGNIFIKAATIDVGGATFQLAGEQEGTLVLSLGPHSVVEVDEGTGGFLNWSVPDGTPSITDSDMLVTATSHDGGGLDGMGGNVERSDGDSFGNGSPTTDSSMPNGIELASADTSNPFLGFFTIDLQRTGGSTIPPGSEAVFSFEVLEPDGTVVFQHLVVSLDSNTKYTFQAQGGELIQKAFVTSNTAGYTIDPVSGIPIPNSGGNPTVNRLRNVKDVEVATGVIIVEKQTLPGGSLEQFDFNLDSTSDPLFEQFDFVLSDGDSYSRAVTAGTFTVEELLTADQIANGWGISDISLSGDTDGLDSVNLAEGSATVQVDNLDIVTVTFTNAQGGRIIVSKDVLAGDENQAFGFDASFIAGTQPDFTISETGGAFTSDVLSPGTYSVTELAELGWFFDGVISSDPDSTITTGSTATVDLAAGQTIELTFNNTQGARIQVAKNVLDGSTTTAFDFLTDYDADNFSLAHGETDTSVYLRPGDYSVSEDLPVGWFFDGIDSSSTGTGSVVNTSGTAANVALAAGELVSLTFNNTQGARIQVAKNVLDGSTTTAFDFLTDYDADNFSLAHGETDTSVYLRPGDYSVSEDLPVGWFFDGIDSSSTGTGSVVNTSGTAANVALAAGELVSLTFNNTQGARIQVAKNVLDGSTTTAFDFLTDYDADNFSLAHGETDTSVYLRPGDYSVSEDLPVGWFFDGIDSSSTGTGSVVNTSGTAANVALAAGELVSLTFNNTQGARIQVAKNVLDGSTTTAFDFLTDYDADNFSLAHGETDTSVYLRPGDYSVSEDLPVGWFFDGIDSSSTGTGSVVNTSGTAANVALAAGELVSLTFNNTQGARIQVAKNVLDGSTTTAFDFLTDYDADNFSLAHGETDTSVYLRPGDYSVSEDLPVGWFFDGIDSSSTGTGSVVNTSGTAANVALAAGELVSLTFNNTQGARIQVAKNVLDGSTTTAFDFLTDYDADNFSLAHGETDTSVYLRPGDYSVSENLPVGWFFDGVDSSSTGTGSVVNTSGTAANVALAAGELVSLTFNNTQGARIQVAKNVLDGSTTTAFDFLTDYDADNFSLAHGETDTSVYLRPGDYSVSEDLPVGWFFDGIDSSSTGTGSVVNTSGTTANVALAAGELVSLTFNNTQGARIQVAKNVLDGSTTTAFDFLTDYDADNFSLAHGETDTSVYLRPGDYSVSEDLPVGWFFDGIDSSSTGTGSVVDTSGTAANVALAAGELVSLTFNNTQGARIQVAKNVLDGSTTTAFDFLTDYDADNFSLAHGETDTSVYLRPGDYSVSEDLPVGWFFDGIDSSSTGTGSVVNTSGTAANVALAAGELVSLTFNNTQGARIQVAKNVLDGSTTTAFDFLTDYDADNFSLAHGETDTSVYLRPGDYSVSEDLPVGWFFGGVESSSTGSGSVVGTSGTTASVSLAAGELVSLTFNNTQGAQIRVTKNVVDGSTTTAFDFLTDYDPDNFSLAHGETDASVYLQPGDYTVSEDLPTGWFFDGVDSSSTGNGSVVNSSGTTANVALAAGEVVSLTFNNTQGARIQVAKNVLDGSTTTVFDFLANYDADNFSLAHGETDTSVYLRPGDYSVSEDLPVGWFFDGIDSSSTGTGSVVNTSGTTANVALAAGELVSLTFNNTQGARIQVAKNVLDGSTTTAFDFLTDYDADNFSLAHGETDTSVYLRPGDYSVSEDLPVGWFFDGIDSSSTGTGSVVNTSGTAANVALAAGELVSLTFNNTQGARIQVAKNVLDGSTTTAFDFLTDYDADNFSLAHGETDTSVYLRPGDYSVSEDLPVGWFFDGIDSSSTGTGSVVNTSGTAANVALAAGELVSLTFNNTQGARIQVAKNVLDGSTTTAFDFLTDYDADNFSLAHGETDTSVYLRPGDYSVSEDLPVGWFFDGIDSSSTGTGSVVNTSGTAANVALAAGELVSLTFNNTQGARIQVAKNVLDGSTTTAFDFLTDYDADNFSLAHGETDTSVYLRPGDYSVSEDLPVGWFFDGIDSSSTGTGSVVNTSGTAANVALAAGELVSLTFNNTQGAQIKVTNNVLEGSTTTEFDFLTDYDPDNFSLVHGEMDTSVYLRPGDYSVSEDLPVGWFFDGIDSSSTGTGSVVDTSGTTANVALAAGELVSLVFNNSQGSRIVVAKEVNQFYPDERSFEFAADFDPGQFQLSDGESITSPYLRSGEYNVREILGHGPYSLTGISISGGTGTVNLPAGIATVNAVAGGTITVQFTNSQIPPTYFKWDPIFPDGVGSGCAYYYSPDRCDCCSGDLCEETDETNHADDDEESDLVRSSSFDTFTRN